MAPLRGKRVRSTSPSAATTPVRKSACLEAQPSSSTRQPSAGLSIMSTDTDTSESWEALRAEAAERVDSYEPQNRPDEGILKASLHACLQWLPERAVTGQMEVKHWIKCKRPADIPKGHVEAAHIIPISYASWDKASVISSQRSDHVH
ncbi:hypothetical protein BA78_8219 [Aspergillus fumigatus]|nr:hypothetical protein BA78_8219 [Aspergillus fumigatus]